MTTPVSAPAPRVSQMGPALNSSSNPLAPPQASQDTSAPALASGSQRVSQTVPTEPSQGLPLQRASQSNIAPKKSLQPSPTNSRRSSQVVPALSPPKKNSQASPQVSPSKRSSQRSPSRRDSQMPPSLSQGEKPPGQETEALKRPSQLPLSQGVDARRSSQVSAQAQEATPSQRPSVSQNARRSSQALPPINENAVSEGLPDTTSSQAASIPSQGIETPQNASTPQIPTNESAVSDISSQTTGSAPTQPEQPKEPGRAVPYREKPETKVMRRISLEMRHRMFLMGTRVTYNEMGPTGCIFYVMGEIGKTFVVKLKEFPCCQCGDFLLERLCKHMMFVSLRVFRLEQTDHRIWQNALLPSELKSLLAHPLITPPVKPPFRSKLRKPLVAQQPPSQPPSNSQHSPPPPLLPPKEIPICCPVCFDEIQFFDNEVKKPLGAKPGPKPKLDMGTRRKKEDIAKVEEVLAEPWAERIKKWESLLHCPTRGCQNDSCMKVVHELCYLKWNRFKRVNYELPHICTINNFYPCAFKTH